MIEKKILLSKYLLLLLLLELFIYQFSAYDGFITVKLVTFNLLSLGLLISCLIFCKTNEVKATFRIAPSLFDKLFLILSAYIFLSTFWSKVPLFSLGCWFVFFVGLVIAYLMVGFLSRSDIHKVGITIYIIGLVFAFYIVLQKFDFFGLTILSRILLKTSEISGTIGNPNFVANFLLFPLSFSFVLFDKHRLMYLLSVIFFAFSILLTGSRGAIVGGTFSVLLSFLLFYSLKNNRIKLPMYFIYFIFIFIFIVLFLYSTLGLIYMSSTLDLYVQKVNNFLNQYTDMSAMYRIPLQAMGWIAISENPIFGNGLGNFTAHSLEYQAKLFQDSRFSSMFRVMGKPIHVHNVWLELWGDLGLIGIILLWALIFLFFYNALSSLEKVSDIDRLLLIGSASTVFSFIVHSFFSFPLFLPANFFYFIISIAIGRSYFKDQDIDLNRYKVNPKVLLVFGIIFVIGLAIAADRGIRYYLSNAYYTHYINKEKLTKKNELSKDEKNKILRINNTYLKGSVEIVNNFPVLEPGVTYMIHLRNFKKYRDAILIGERMLKIEDGAFLQRELGFNYMELKKYKEALPHLLKAFYSLYFFNRKGVGDLASAIGECYFRIDRKNIDKSISWTENALKYKFSTAKREIIALFNLSIYYYYKHRYTDALECLKKAKLLLQKNKESFINKKQVSPSLLKWYLDMQKEVEEFEEKIKKKDE